MCSNHVELIACFFCGKKLPLCKLIEYYLVEELEPVLICGGCWRTSEHFKTMKTCNYYESIKDYYKSLGVNLE